MSPQRIKEISVTPIPAHYRKELGKNAYADNRGTQWLEWVVRARTDQGVEGITLASRFMRESNVEALLDILREVFMDRPVDDLLNISGGRVTGPGAPVARAFEQHGWMSILAYDLVGRVNGVSCVDLLGGRVRDSVPAYDTTLYFQDFLDPEKGPAKAAEEAAEARRAGYRQAKIKVGRGGRWMLPEAGMRRDVDVVLAIREAVGPDFTLMVDGNFGYDGHLDLLDDFVRETVPADIFWLEEMITHDLDGYRAIREMQARHGSKALLTCGEVDRTPISTTFRYLIEDGLIDGYQPDIVAQGFSTWQRIERELEGTGVRSIPHNFGNGCFGTYASLAFGAASETFASIEDERCIPHVFTPAHQFENGSYKVGDAPGLGIEIDEEKFQSKYAANEFRVTG